MKYYRLGRSILESYQSWIHKHDTYLKTRIESLNCYGNMLHANNHTRIWMLTIRPFRKVFKKADTVSKTNVKLNHPGWLYAE